MFVFKYVGFSQYSRVPSVLSFLQRHPSNTAAASWTVPRKTRRFAMPWLTMNTGDTCSVLYHYFVLNQTEKQFYSLSSSLIFIHAESKHF